MITWYESIMSYWRRRAYERIGTSEPSDPSRTSRVTRPIRLRRMQRRRRRTRTPFARLRLQALSPLRLLARLRDVYVDAMLGMARDDRGGGNVVSSHQVTTTTPQGVWVGRVPSARRRSASARSSEFERRMMVLHLCNSLGANPELLHS